MERKPGFYWVRLNAKWVVAEFDSQCGVDSWYVSGVEVSLNDRELDEIREVRIAPPDEYVNPEMLILSADNVSLAVEDKPFVILVKDGDETLFAANMDRPEAESLLQEALK